MPGIASVGATGSQSVNGLLSGIKWSVNSLTYSFPASASFYGSGYGSGEPSSGFAALNATQRSAVVKILAEYAAVASLTFTQVTESYSTHGDLRYANSSMPWTAWAYYPWPSPEGGDSWYGTSGNYYSSPVRANYAYATFLHETGHALGLKHAHEADSYGAMPLAHDSMEYTIMSYRSYVGASTTQGYTNETWGYAQTPMMYDVAALQHMYGANYATNSGNTTYSWSATTGEMFVNGVGQGVPGGNRIFMTVWDGGGTDTYDFSNYATQLSIDLNPGAWIKTGSSQLARLHYADGSRLAQGNIANALLFQGNTASLIENAIGGSANDTIIGNEAANVLHGNGGNDIIYGGAGNDWICGGHGIDRLDGGAGIDTVSYAFSSANWVVDLLNNTARSVVGDEQVTGFENIECGSGRDILIGNSAANVLTGGGGDDVFVFRPGGKADTITDFSAGAGSVDRIDLSIFSSLTSFAAVLGITTQSGADAVLSFGGGDSLTLLDVLLTSLVPDDFILGSGDLVAASAGSDFGGDGLTDLLWRHSSGAVQMWQMNGSLGHSQASLATVGVGWSIRGIGDFNRDGKSDIVWYDGKGSSFIWQMDGAQVESVHTLPTIDHRWNLLGTGDFNGDGTSDLLWRHETGAVFTWLMDGGQILASSHITNAALSWFVQGIGDFNADGRSDVLWRNVSGATFIWQMSGVYLDKGINLGTTAKSWHISATGDFDGDGTSDILWRTDSGANFMWQMDDGRVEATLGLPSIDARWRAQATGDLNNDGAADIVWRHSTGANSAWLMDGNQVIAQGQLAALDANWHIANQVYDLL